jgi:hypothetical protein
MDNKKYLGELIHLIEPFMERRSFSRDKFVFRKKVQDNLTQIVNFGLGNTLSIYQGKFTVDLCVFIPEVFNVFNDKPLPKKPTSYHCELVKRLPSLEPGVEDKWWCVDQIGAVSEDISNLMLKYGFPFLENLSSRSQIYTVWQQIGEEIGLPPRGKLVIAAMLKSYCDTGIVKKLIDEEIETNFNETSYVQFVKNTAEKLKIT